jgi:hypothetical protein
MTNAIAEKEQTMEEDLRASIKSFQIVEVTDAASFKEAGERDKKLTELKNKWSDYWAKIKKSAHETWKGIVAKEKDILDIADEKKTSQKQLAKAWFDAEEKKRIEAERAAQEAARKQAEEDALAQAVAAEQSGDKEEAEAIISAPVVAPQVVVPTTVPKGYGGVTPKYYNAALTGIKALARPPPAGEGPEKAIMGNDTFLNAQARMLKETMNWPGVKVNVR